MERISIDLIPGGYKPTCHASQFDDGRVIRFDLFNRRVPYTLISGESVEIKITKPNGSERTEYIANTQSSYVDWTTVKETCDVAGDYSCELVVSKDGKVIGSGNFTLAVEIDAYGDSTITVHTASGAIATFETNMVDVLQSVKCEINATGGNGTPDNPNSINGFTEAHLTRCGVNLYSNIFSEYRKPFNYYLKNVPLKIGTTYTLKAVLKDGGTAVSGCYVGVANNGEQYSEFSAMIPCVKIDGIAQTQTFIPTNTWVSPKLIIYVANEAQFNSLFENYDILLVEGRDTTYHPYTGNTYAIALGDTYYGGVLDVTRGKLRVTWIGDTINNMPFQYWAGGVVFYANLTDKKNGNTNVISDIFETLQNGGYGELSDGQIVGRSDGNTVYIKDTAYTDVSAFKSARGNGLIVYELATPFDIDLTPQQIEALLGVNNIWHDGNGDTEVKYLKKDS